MTNKILLIGENVESHAEYMAREFEVHTLTGKPDREAYLAEIAPEIEGLCISGGANPRPNGDLLDRMPKVSIVASLGVGATMIDVPDLKQRGIIATIGPGSNAVSVADFALGLMLAVTRRMVYFDRYTREGKWASTGTKGAYTTTITGKAVGIVGLGAIGSRVAKRCQGFEMELLYHQRTRNEDVGYRYVDSVLDLAAEADYLVICCPGTPETRHLVDADVLKALGPGGYLISVSRGTVIDEAALVTALQDGTIAGAGLEVFEFEPDPSPELFEMENVVLSPHRSAFTIEATTLMRDMMMANLRAHFAGKPVPNPVPGMEELQPAAE